MMFPSTATCSILGDPHINTFDGKSYNMHGKCAYVMSEHCHYNSSVVEKKFSIVLKNVNCQSGAACSRQLILNITGAPLITLGSTSNGANSFLPTITVENGNPKTYYSDLVDIEHVGKQTVQVHASIGLMLTWTGYNAYLTVEPGLEGQTCGLCGTFNRNAGDDFHKRDGGTEVTAIAFSKEWMLPDSIQVDPNCHGTSWTNLDNLCNLYSNNRAYANSSCNHIRAEHGIFKHCHQFIPPNEFYQKCLGDGCKCKDCLCEVVAAYARACAERNIVVEGWRNVITDCAASKCSLIPIHGNINPQKLHCFDV
jgi:integrin beta 3